jgi:hypothetical protein
VSKKILYILTPLVAVALLLAVVVFVPAVVPATAAAPAAVGQASLACASFQETATQSRTALAPGNSITVTGVAGSPVKVVSGSVAVATSKSTLRIAAPTDRAFGGTSIATDDDGPLRGVSLASCRAPSTDAWITGVSSNDDVLTDLVLTNLDKDDAAVDLTIYGATGEVNAVGARGIVVGAGEQRSIALKPLVSQSGPLSIHAQTSEGRLSVIARQTVWKGTTAVGTDWVAPSVAGTDVIVPGVPAGSGTRRLVVTNPGDRSVTASIRALTANGSVALEGATAVDIPPQSTRFVSLETGLAQAAAAVRVTAPTTVTAAVIAETATPGDASDIAVASAGGSLPRQAVFPLAAGTSAKATLILSNATSQDAAATVRFSDASGKPLGEKSVTMTAGGSTTVAVPTSTTVSVGVETTQGSLHGAIAVTATLGKVSGLGIATYAGLVDDDPPELMRDPHVDEQTR